MDFIEHALIKPGVVERREYQVNLASACREGNTLLVLPTGLGKTVIALLLVAEYLQRQPEKGCLILAPTRVLVHQHQTLFTRYLSLPEGSVDSVTGEDRLEVRRERWGRRVVCATPQITRNDLERGLVDLSRVSLIIFDEAHRAVGEHPYPQIASHFLKVNPEGRIVGMTASLPSEEGRVQEVLRNLGSSRLLARDERSGDVKGYVQRTEVEWVEVTLPPVMVAIAGELKAAVKSHIEVLRETELFKEVRWRDLGLKALLDLRRRVDETRDFRLKTHLVLAIRLTYALGLLEAQSLSSLVKFLERAFSRQRGMGVKQMLRDPHVKRAYEMARGALLLGVEHPKVTKLEGILSSLREGGRAIVFASYRDTVEGLCERLSSAGFRVGFLIGKSGERGLSQVEQVRILEELREGAFDVLVATQVGEEGLDVAECDMVVFYDNVPSAVRFIQRRGRTGRRAPGRVFILMTKGTRDEAYHWVSRRKISQARRIMRRVGREGEGPSPEGFL